MAEKEDIYKKLNEAIEKFINEDIIPFTSGDFQKMIGVKSLKDVDGNIVPWTSYFDDLIGDSSVNEFLLFLQSAGDISLSERDTRQIGRVLWDAKTNPDALKGFALDINKVDNVGHLVWSTIQTQLPHLQTSFVKLGQPDDLTPLGDNLVKYFNIPDTPTNVVDERKFYDPSDDLDEFGLPLTDEAKEEILSLDNQLIDDNGLDGLTMPESPQELLETGKPGNVVLTEDGYKFIILPDGQLTDGDIVYGSLRELRDEVSTDIIDTLNSEEYKSKLKEFKERGIEFDDTPTNVVDDVPTNVIDLDNQVVIDTEYGSGRDITVTVDKDGNVVLFRGTDDPNRGINVNFESQVGSREVGYGKGNYFSPNLQYAANYAQPSGRRLYGFTTDIKPNEILNFRTKISDNIELAKKLGVEDIYWDVSNPNHQSFSWYDLFHEMDKEDVWNEAIGDYEVTKKSKYGRSWFQNNIDIFTDNGVKAFITTEQGTGRYTRAEIFPLVTETNNLNIKPVVQYSVDGAGVNLSQFTEIPLDTPGGSLSGGSLGAAKLNDPLVFDSWVDNLGRTTASFVDNLPLETVVKNRVKKLIARKSAQAATPGGIMDFLDAWEFAVLGLMAAIVAFSEIDEVPTIVNNTAINMFNSMTSFYGIAPVPKQEYELNYEFITKVLDTGEKFMPTDIIAKKGVEEFKEGQEAGIDISAGLGAQAGVFGNSVTTPAKTDTMETTQKIQPGVQEEKMFEQAKPKKSKPTGGAGAKIL